MRTFSPRRDGPAAVVLTGRSCHVGAGAVGARVVARLPSAAVPDLALDDLFRLDGQVAIVTGASSGLGERFARVLHAAGAIPVLAARRADRMSALAAELPGAVVVADRRHRRGRSPSASSTPHAAVIGRIDVLVNNAGITDPVPSEDESDGALPPHHGGQPRRRRASLPARRPADARPRARGSIVNIASIFGMVAASPINEASYVASKHAVVGLTRQLGSEWIRRGVRVNAIAPGWFRTEMAEVMFTDPVRSTTSGATLLLAGAASPTSSTVRCSSWPPPPAPTSPARCSPSTAGGRRGEVDAPAGHPMGRAGRPRPRWGPGPGGVQRLRGARRDDRTTARTGGGGPA